MRVHRPPPTSASTGLCRSTIDQKRVSLRVGRALLPHAPPRANLPRRSIQSKQPAAARSFILVAHAKSSFGSWDSVESNDPSSRDPIQLVRFDRRSKPSLVTRKRDSDEIGHAFRVTELLLRWCKKSFMAILSAIASRNPLLLGPDSRAVQERPVTCAHCGVTVMELNFVFCHIYWQTFNEMSQGHPLNKRDVDPETGNSLHRFEPV